MLEQRCEGYGEVEGEVRVTVRVWLLETSKKKAMHVFTNMNVCIASAVCIGMIAIVSVYTFE